MMVREVLGALGNEQYRAYVADIHASGTHLLQIINDILDLSKAEAGKLELHEDVFDLRDIMRSVGQLTAGRIHEAALSYQVTLPDDLPPLRGDERKTKQVLLNLVSNAVKFTPSGGQITVSGQFDPEVGLAVTVTDTGIGIPSHDLDRVLKPFEQVDSSFSRSHQGTGLGLPLVKAIMELHGGRLALSSELGVGTAVTVVFPPDRAILDPSSLDSGSTRLTPVLAQRRLAFPPSLAPAREAAERRGGHHRAHDRARQAIARGGAEPRQPVGRGRGAAPGRQRKYRIAIERRVRRTDRLGQPVLRHDREPAAAVLVERRVGGDHRDRRVGADDRPGAGRIILEVERGRRGCRLGVDLAGERQLGGPQPPAIRPHHRPPAVDRDERADRRAPKSRGG